MALAEALNDPDLREASPIVVNGANPSSHYEAGRNVGVAVPLGAVVAQLVAATVNQGDGGLDHSGLFKQVLKLSGRE